MEHVKEKMAQARQHRKMLQENPQAQTDFIQADRDSTSNLAKFNRYLSLGRNASLFIGGAAAGIVVVAIVWWVKSAGVAGDTSTIALETAEAIQARGAAVLQSGTSGFKKPIDGIAHLNERVESLNNTIINLEVKLMHVLSLADSIADIESKRVTATQHYKSATNETESAFDTMEPTASGIVPTTHETTEAFIPTHTVNARLNLRPSVSLSTTPIAILKVGAQVEYRSEIDDWYYVNTKSSGKGWCASSYLSSL